MPEGKLFIQRLVSFSEKKCAQFPKQNTQVPENREGKQREIVQQSLFRTEIFILPRFKRNFPHFSEAGVEKSQRETPCARWQRAVTLTVHCQTDREERHCIFSSPICAAQKLWKKTIAKQKQITLVAMKEE